MKEILEVKHTWIKLVKVHDIYSVVWDDLPPVYSSTSYEEAKRVFDYVSKEKEDEMKREDLQEGVVYQYTGGINCVAVMYVGRDNGKYGFWSYNEDSGKYDGFYNRLSGLTVENQISKR